MQAFYQLRGLGDIGKTLKKVERCGDRLPCKPYEKVCKSIIINRKLPFSFHYFEVTIKALARSTNCGLWGIWGNVARCGEIWGTFDQKVSDKFCQSIFSVNNLSSLAYYFEATTKSSCMRFTNCGCWKMWENDGEDAKVWG